MPNIRCPECRTELDLDPEWVGQTIQCGSCQAEFVAKPPAPAPARRPARPAPPEPPADRPSRRHAAEGDDAPARPRPSSRRRDDEDDDQDDRPRPRKKKKKAGSAGRTLLILGAVALLGVAVVCVGGVVWVVGVFKSPASFDPAGWKEFSLPDGSCSVSFPVPPRQEPIAGVGGADGAKFMHQVALPKDAVLVFGFVSLPGGQRHLFDAGYQAERDSIRQATGAKISREADVTVEGYPAKEIEYNLNGDILVYRMVYLSGNGQGKLVMLMAGGKHLAAADRTRFLDSFKVKARP